MKKEKIALLAFGALTLLAGCGTNPDSISSSCDSTDADIKKAVDNVNLALSDLEGSLSNYLSRKNQGLSLSNKDEDTPLISLSFASDSSFSAGGSSSSEIEGKKHYTLDAYCDDLSFKAFSLDKKDECKMEFGSNDIYLELKGEEDGLDLPFRQGLKGYLATIDKETGLYLDASKAALTRAFLSSVYPEKEFNERSYIDLTDVFEKGDFAFPLNSKMPALATSLRKNVQEAIGEGEAHFYCYDGDPSTYLSYRYDDLPSLKEKANDFIDILFDSEESADKKEEAKEFVSKIKSVSADITYAFNEEEPLYVGVVSSLSVDLGEGDSGLSSIDISAIGDFLGEEECSFEFPSNLSDRSIWLS